MRQGPLVVAEVEKSEPHVVGAAGQSHPVADLAPHGGRLAGTLEGSLVIAQGGVDEAQHVEGVAQVLPFRFRAKAGEQPLVGPARLFRAALQEQVPCRIQALFRVLRTGTLQRKGQE